MMHVIIIRRHEAFDLKSLNTWEKLKNYKMIPSILDDSMDFSIDKVVYPKIRIKIIVIFFLVLLYQTDSNLKYKCVNKIK